MKPKQTTLSVGLSIAAVLLTGCAGTTASSPNRGFAHELTTAQKPWTHDRFEDDPGRFTFAIVSDLNGGERDRVFEVAVEQLSLLRPRFIMTVGDLIDGASEDPRALHAEWDSFDGRARGGAPPLFRVSGNHDATAQPLRDVWVERYGALYYHFVYENVLFLVLDTEDYTPERRLEMRNARNEALQVTDRAELAQTEYYQMPERLTGEIGPEQSAYVQRVLADHPSVRWTMLFMHKPVWQRNDEPDFAAIASALADRPYTLFNGHFHRYSHTVNNGRDHIMLGTTGGGQNPTDEMSFDHVTLVTMDREGPSIAHLRLDGILDKTGRVPLGGDTLCFQASGGCD
jgi:hypothetical protein